MNMSTTIRLTGQEIDEYQQNGFVIVRGLFSAERMSKFKCTVETKVFESRPEDGSGVPVYFLDDMPESFRSFCTCPELTTIVQQLLGPAVEFLSVKPVYKNSDVSFPSDWHQDYAYWGGTNKLSVWIALDDATPENGCLRFIPGAHHDFIPHNQKDGTFGQFLREDQLDMSRVIDAPMAAGDACFFIDIAPHASYGNTSGRDRWSFIPTYRDASASDSSTVWKTSVRI